MSIPQLRFRQYIRRLHRSLAPIMLLPLLLTLGTGSIFQIMELSGNEEKFGWLLDWHKGDFGMINLEKIYPLFNAIGLLFLLLTGIFMWWQTQRFFKSRSD